MFTILDYSSALEYSIIRRYTNIVYYYYYYEVLCELHALQLQHNPMYLIFGEDLNTDLSRDMSRHTKSLIQYLIDDDIICSGTIHVSIPKLYSYCSRINQSTSFLDYFIFSRELLKHVVKIQLLMIWRIVLIILDAYLKSIIIPYHLAVCTDVHCTRHMSEIEHLYCSIVNVMLIAGRNAIHHSKPHRTNHNWRTKIEPLKEIALFWHNEYCERGRPDSGFYFEMRKHSRKLYHAKT